MGVSNVNVFEQHMEKIVLAVAAAGAVFMGYLAIQPTAIPGDPNNPDDRITANDIEKRLGVELDKMQEAGEKIKAQPKPFVSLSLYEDELKKLSSHQPLDAALLSPKKVPLFGPKNMSPTRVERPSGDATQLVVTPKPVPPENVTAEAWQQLVAVQAPAPPVPGMPAPVPNGAVPLRDQNATLIQGYIPVGAMVLEMASGKDKLPPNLEKAVVHRINVQRRERTSNGWTEFTDVQPTKASSSPTEIDWKLVAGDDMPAQVLLIESEFTTIVVPSFYLDSQLSPIQPPILTQPLPRAISEEIRKLRAGIEKARQPVGVTPGLITTPVVAPTAAAAAGAAIPAETLPPVADLAKDFEVIPFAFWDETVKPDHTYQYRVSVDFLNPTYKWNWGLKDKDMKTVSVLKGAWVNIPNPVVIHSDIAFFVMGPDKIGADVRVFKKSDGKWYWSQFVAQPGMTIAGQIALVDKPGSPNMDVDTNFMVVDAQPSSDGSNVHLVLKDPSGNLITRDSNNDRDDKSNVELLAASTKRAAATAPADATAGGLTNPTTPGRGTATTRISTPVPTRVAPPATSAPARPTYTPDPRAKLYPGGGG